MSDDTPDALTEQPIPEASCPECGGEPHENANHNLSATGYLHDDVLLVCSECDHAWTKGIPIGESDEFADDLRCPDCGDAFGLVHKPVSPTAPADMDGEHPETFRTSMKCPECYAVWTIERELDDSGVCCIGYPQVVGDRENADRSSW